LAAFLVVYGNALAAFLNDRGRIARFDREYNSEIPDPIKKYKKKT